MKEFFQGVAFGVAIMVLSHAIFSFFEGIEHLNSQAAELVIETRAAAERTDALAKKLDRLAAELDRLGRRP